MSARLYTTVEAAELLGIPAAAIADMKHHGRVVPADVIRGRGRGGQVPLYDIEELRPLAQEYLERVARHADSGPS